MTKFPFRNNKNNYRFVVEAPNAEAAEDIAKNLIPKNNVKWTLDDTDTAKR